MSIHVVPAGQESAVARALAGDVEEIPERWGCPTCGSKNVTVLAVKGDVFRVPIKSLWASPFHGARAHLDWENARSAGKSTTFHELRCDDCGWSSDSKGDTSVLRRP